MEHTRTQPPTGAFAPEHHDDSAPLDHQHAAPPRTPLRAPIRPPQIVTQQQPLPTTNLSSGSVEFLREEGYDDAAIATAAKGHRAKRSSNGAKQGVLTTDLIVVHAPAIIEMAGGKWLLSAKSVGTALVSLGTIRRPLGYNAVGDKLHGHGLLLPKVRINGVMHYDLSYIGRTVQECEARTARLKALDIAALLMVAGEIKEQVADDAPVEVIAAEPAEMAAHGEPEAQSPSEEHAEEAEINHIAGPPDEPDYTEGEPVDGYPEYEED